MVDRRQRRPLWRLVGARGGVFEHAPHDHGQAGACWREKERGGGGFKANAPLFFLTIPSTPTPQVVYLVNLSEKAYIKKKAKWLPKIFEWVAANGGDPIIPFSGALESRLFDMPDDEKAKELAELETTSALPKIITAGFKAVK